MMGGWDLAVSPFVLRWDDDADLKRAEKLRRT